MIDIDWERYTERFNTAKNQKESSSFRSKILEELKKPEWSERQIRIDTLLSDIKKEEDFKDYGKELTKLFEDIFEAIAAPGADAFVNWMNGLTNDKSEAIGKLRKFLVNDCNYANYSKLVASIASNENVLEVRNDNLIFSSLLKEIRKVIKMDCENFLNDPAEFEKNIDGFLEKLAGNLSSLADIKELTYTEIEELYSEKQKENNIDFYAEIIEQARNVNQKLGSSSDSTKSGDLIAKIKRLIEDIYEVIKKLDKTNIANDSDDTVKEMFLLFKDMIKFEKNVSQCQCCLENFLLQTWEGEIIMYYGTIKKFFENVKDIKDSWKNETFETFEAKNRIEIIVRKYNECKKENPLIFLKGKPMKIVLETLTKKYEEIEDYKKETEKTKQAVLENFKKIQGKYFDRLSLIKKLDKKTCKQIKEEGINALDNALKEFKNKDIITYLSEDFEYDLVTCSKMEKRFEETIRSSDMKDSIFWLEERLGDEKSRDISEADLDEGKLKELLSNGLIKLTITKAY